MPGVLPSLIPFTHSCRTFIDHLLMPDTTKAVKDTQIKY